MGKWTQTGRRAALLQHALADQCPVGVLRRCCSDIRTFIEQVPAHWMCAPSSHMSFRLCEHFEHSYAPPLKMLCAQRHSQVLCMKFQV